MTIKGVVYFAVAYFNVFGSQCYPIPTWRPMHQQTRQEIPTWRHRQPQTWPEIPTWHVQAWPTQPHIPDIMKPDINWTPYIVPTVSYNSEGMASGIVVPAISAVLFVLFTIGVRFLCKRARPNQAHQAHVLTVPNVSTPIHEVRNHDNDGDGKDDCKMDLL